MTSTLRPLAVEDWPTEVAEARALQESLRDRVIREDRLPAVRSVAGVDASYRRAEGTMRAAVARLSFPELEPLEYAVARRKTPFPYVPGYLSFRETPAALEALSRLHVKPDLVLCDAHGLAHPRRFGMASHLGVLADLPTIGVAKSLLVGTHDELSPDRGRSVPLRDEDEVIGAVLRTRAGVKPMYVSIGHRISLETAIEYVLACAPRFRLPEPTRRADRVASGWGRGLGSRTR